MASQQLLALGETVPAFITSSASQNLQSLDAKAWVVLSMVCQPLVVKTLPFVLLRLVSGTLLLAVLLSDFISSAPYLGPNFSTMPNMLLVLVWTGWNCYHLSRCEIPLRNRSPPVEWSGRFEEYEE